MPAHNTASETEPTNPHHRLTTEAEALCYMLGDLGVIVGVNLRTDGLFITLGENPKPGAIDVLNVMQRRAIDDDAFREELISAIGTCGFYLADSPAINSDAKNWSADKLLHALERVGLGVRVHYGVGPAPARGISFVVLPETELSSNAHLLMKLVVDRFASEPDFASDLTRLASTADRLRHDD